MLLIFNNGLETDICLRFIKLYHFTRWPYM